MVVNGSAGRTFVCAAVDGSGIYDSPAAKGVVATVHLSWDEIVGIPERVKRRRAGVRGSMSGSCSSCPAHASPSCGERDVAPATLEEGWHGGRLGHQPAW